VQAERVGEVGESAEREESYRRKVAHKSQKVPCNTPNTPSPRNEDAPSRNRNLPAEAPINRAKKEEPSYGGERCGPNVQGCLARENTARDRLALLTYRGERIPHFQRSEPWGRGALAWITNYE